MELVRDTKRVHPAAIVSKYAAVTAEQNRRCARVENCLNARGCFYVQFKAKRRVCAVSFID